ncbi:MAG: glycosyltransferase family 2 protein [bacterium]
MAKISICIPTYEMHGEGTSFLQRSFEALLKQSFKDFDVVISDHSKDTKIQEFCETYRNQLQIHYHKNTEHLGSSSANINNAMTKATGTLIKILFQDDFLYGNDSLEKIVKNFDTEKDHWLVTACNHTTNGTSFSKTHYPTYNSNIYLGKNTIGAPSVLTLKNQNIPLFDNNLAWLMDCDYYRKCYDRFGKLKILNEITVSIGLGEHQVTNTEATTQIRYEEYRYCLRKYGKTFISFPYRLRVVGMFYIKKLIRKFRSII